MDQRTKILLYAGGFLGLIAFLIVMAIIFPPPQRNAQQKSTALSEDEARLTEEKPQHLITNSGKTGILVVTANLTGGYVFIDQQAEVLPEGSGDIQSTPLYPPFRIESVPVGKHTITALRDGSPRQEIGFEIKENEATRVQITFTQRY